MVRVCVHRSESIWLVTTCWVNHSLGRNHRGILQNNFGIYACLISPEGFTFFFYAVINPNMVQEDFKRHTDITLRKEKRAGEERKGGMSQKHNRQENFDGNENINSMYNQ